MTDWLGMAAAPRTPRPELKERVLARALAARRRPPWGLAAAAAVALVVAGGMLWSVRSVRQLAVERAQLRHQVAALEDTLSLIRGPGTRVIQIPVTTGGQVGAVTIFADSTTHRWLIACHGIAPNAPGQVYQLWFITERGMRSAGLMPMPDSHPMVVAVGMPQDAGHVMGAAMSIEPQGGSPEPRGPMVFHLHL